MKNFLQINIIIIVFMFCFYFLLDSIIINSYFSFIGYIIIIDLILYYKLFIINIKENHIKVKNFFIINTILTVFVLCFYLLLELTYIKLYDKFIAYIITINLIGAYKIFIIDKKYIYFNLALLILSYILLIFWFIFEIVHFWMYSVLTYISSLFIFIFNIWDNNKENTHPYTLKVLLLIYIILLFYIMYDSFTLRMSFF